LLKTDKYLASVNNPGAPHSDIAYIIQAGRKSLERARQHQEGLDERSAVVALSHGLICAAAINGRLDHMAEYHAQFDEVFKRLRV